MEDGKILLLVHTWLFRKQEFGTEEPLHTSCAQLHNFLVRQEVLCRGLGLWFGQWMLTNSFPVLDKFHLILDNKTAEVNSAKTFAGQDSWASAHTHTDTHRHSHVKYFLLLLTFSCHDAVMSCCETSLFFFFFRHKRQELLLLHSCNLFSWYSCKASSVIEHVGPSHVGKQMKPIRPLRGDYLVVQLPPILVQLWQRLVATLEELGLGLHQQQHLTLQHEKSLPRTHPAAETKQKHAITCSQCTLKAKATTYFQKMNQSEVRVNSLPSKCLSSFWLRWH